MPMHVSATRRHICCRTPPSPLACPGRWEKEFRDKDSDRLQVGVECGEDMECGVGMGAAR